MVRRIYVERKRGLREEAENLRRELNMVLGVASLEFLRVLNRYDVEGLEEEVFGRRILQEELQLVNRSTFDAKRNIFGTSKRSKLKIFRCYRLW